VCTNLIFVSGGLMDITTSFRHIDVDEEVRLYIEEKMARLQKYIETPLDVHVVVSLERKYRHRVDVMFTINGVVINAHEVMDDTRAAVDKILDKLERRLTKYTDKLKKYREAKTKRSVVKGEPEESNIITTKILDAKPMDPEEATMQLRASGDNFIIFRERERDNVCLVYKRKDGKYSLIETVGKKP
jgi:putative sigma-54 modulation protein